MANGRPRAWRSLVTQALGRMRPGSRAFSSPTVLVKVAVIALSLVFVGTAASLASSGAPSRRAAAQLAPASSAGQLRGNYNLSNVAFGDAQKAYVTVGGTSTLPGEASTAWFETTTDGGDRWVPTELGPGTRRAAAAWDLAFVDADDGWAYSGVGGNGLYATTDGGRNWSSQLPGQVVGTLVVSGRSAWLVAWKTCRACEPRAYSTTGPGAPVRPLAVQPPGGSLVSLARPAPAVGLAPTSADGRSTSLVVTDDGGRHWTARLLPCQPGRATPGGPANLVATSAQDLWATCQDRSESMDMSEALSVVYRSFDQGRSWQRVTPVLRTSQAIAEGLFDTVADLDPVRGEVVWALETDDEAGNGPVMRSTDGGRTWHSELESFLPGRPANEAEPLEISALTVISATTAWVSALAFSSPTASSSRPVLLCTTDGGAAWSTITLPIPPGVPTTSH